jgi:YtkA-like protein
MSQRPATRGKPWDSFIVRDRSRRQLEKDSAMLNRSRFVALFAGLVIVLGTRVAHAAPADYVFEPVSVEVRNGKDSEFAVRLRNKATGKPVEGAVLFRTRLDMSPDSMGEMTAKHSAMSSSEPGVYKFKADFTMAGGWAFKLMAKVPGENETVQGTVVFKAK